MSVRTWIAVVCLALCVRGVAAGEVLEAIIGIPVRFEDVVIDGLEVEGRACDAQAPLCARVVRVEPHGTARRYTIECTVLEAGEYDVRDYLVRRDGSTDSGLPTLPVKARSALASGSVRPSMPGEGALPRFGGYRALLIAAAIVWVAVLVLVLFTGRRRRVRDAADVAARPASLVERLRVLVARAREQKLGEDERTQLEMSLVSYWRRRLELEDLPAHDLLPRLRAHPDAGPLLAGLERWLHAPPGAQDVDVEGLLAPYRDLPEDALDLPAPR